MGFMKPIQALLKTYRDGQRVPSLESEIRLLKCERLNYAIMMIVYNPVYTRGAPTPDDPESKYTSCNIAAYDLLDSRCKVVWNMKTQVAAVEKRYPMGNIIKAFDYDITPIMKEESYDKILNSPIPYVYDECIKEYEKGRVKLLTQEEAQRAANNGIPTLIISKKYNHVAMGAAHLDWSPDIGRNIIIPYDSDKGIYTGNCGWFNDMMFLSDKNGFGYYWKMPDSDIIFVQFKLHGAKDFEIFE